MPRTGITIYDLLISCPGDVTAYLDVIQDSVESFNRYFGSVNNIQIVIKHWSTDSYPQSGDKPQELLNKQFVRDCDAAIAVFWTRFGTPTDEFGSGTEEEIEEMLISGKQVFMYFVDEPINPSQVDAEQYEKVLEFKNRYKDKGIYANVENKDVFRKEFTNHLALHFLPLITGVANAADKEKSPILLVRDVNNKAENTIYICKTHLKDSEFVKNQKEKILEKIIKLNTENILQARDIEIEKPVEPEKIQANEIIKKFDMSKINAMAAFIGSSLNLDFDCEKAGIIEQYASLAGIPLDPGFWNVGNLRKWKTTMALPYSSGTSYSGTEDEKRRYELLDELYWDVMKLHDFTEYFSYLDDYSFLKMTVENVGNSYDEDIVVKLFIEKDILVKIDKIMYPGINIIDDLLKMDFVDCIFAIPENEAVESYAYYPVTAPLYKDIMPMNPFTTRSALDEYELDKTIFHESLEQTYCYKLFENEEEDILVFHMDYLNHNRAMALPAALMIERVPARISYEITSKHTSEIIKGEIRIVNNEVVDS